MPNECIELTSQDVGPIRSALYCNGPKAREFKKAEIEKNDLHECYTACKVRMCIANSICPKGGQIDTHCHQVEQFECLDHKGSLPKPWNGRSLGSFIKARTFWMFEANYGYFQVGNGRLGQWRSNVHPALCTVQISTDAARAEECTEHDPTCHGHMF